MEPLKKEVPKREVICIEYPGFVRNLEPALESLGGDAGIIKAATAITSSILPLRLRTDDPLSRPIFGEKHSTKGLLLKVTRGRGDGEEPVRARIVARVESLFRFPGMADFQFVADDTLTVPPQEEGEAIMISKPEPLLAVPPLFIRNDMPMEYNFCSFYGEDPPAFRGPGGGKAKGQLPPHVFKFVAISVPPPIAKPELVEGKFKPERREHLLKLHDLFIERPIWSAVALHQKISGINFLSELESLLPRLSYTFRSGPFSALWIKRGYDPRKDANSRKYQAVVYTLPSAWAAAISRRMQADDLDSPADEVVPALPPVGKKYSEMSSFTAIPKRQVILQLLDLKDLEISSTLQTSSSLRTCDKFTGWFQAADWASIVQRVELRFQALLDKTPIPMTIAEEQNTQGGGSAPMDVDAEGCLPASQPPGTPEPRIFHSTLLQEQLPRPQPEGNIVPAGVLQGLLASWNESHPRPSGEEEMQLPEAAGPRLSQTDKTDDEFEIFEESEGDEEEEEEEEEDEDEEEDVEEEDEEDEFGDYGSDGA